MKGVVAAEGRAQAAQLQKRAAELERLADERGSGDEEEPELAPPGGANGGASARLGEVVWAREKGWPAWPALVITKETSRDLATLRCIKGGVAVWFFGTREMACVRAAEVTDFGEGLAKGMHASCRRSPRVFRKSLFEAYLYLQARHTCTTQHATSGKMPDQMILDSNDERWFSDADEDASAAGGDGGLPLKLGRTLTVTALGRMEYMRPRFHSRTHIWPLGYSATRSVTVPGSGGRQLTMHCQILQGPTDSSGPLFRVTTEGGRTAESADSPSTAWRELLAAESGAACELRLSGARLFGLENPTVQRLVQALPHAGRCMRFEAWAGPRPDFKPLSAEEEQQRMKLDATAQRLPPGIQPVFMPRLTQGVCSACGEDEETGDNHLLQCDACLQFVHMDCYGVSASPEGRLWLCDACYLGLERPPACALCPVEGGPMKRTTCGRWVHAACELWVPETALDVERGLVNGLQFIHKARFQLVCTLCGQAHGACIQCAGSKQCCSAFHPLCARKAGLHMVAIRDEAESDSEEEQEPVTDRQNDNIAPKETNGINAAEPLVPSCAQKASPLQNIVTIRVDSSGPAAPAPPQPPPAAAGTGACERAQAAAPGVPNGEEQAQHAASAAAEAAGAAALNAAAKPAPARRRVRREGTALGAGLRLMAFCVRHSKPACASPSKRRLAVSISTGRVLQGPASPLACRVASPKAASSAPATHAAQGSQRAAAAALSGPGAAAEEVCSRCQPYNHERRGHRAPDALAVALAKRAFVRALPYRVGGVSRPSQATPLPVVRVHDAQQPSAVFEAACAAAGQPMADARAAGAVAPAEGGGSGRVLSLAQRYEAMARTVPLRLTLGKSAIHGWGAFTKAPAAAGDMLIEYMGEHVRRSVADMRERRLYDSLVGAGTYVFGLGPDTCVDATAAGNMAHLLNHSCEPNAYSRTISVRCARSGVLADHVVICAARDIAAGEELTYDYRFSGEEKLVCNCGAARCRGYVNLAKPHADRDVMLVARHRLRPYV